MARWEICYTWASIIDGWNTHRTRAKGFSIKPCFASDDVAEECNQALRNDVAYAKVLYE
jgi:hypothetical protein